ncbi:hypothetical protein ACWCPF_31505 [Streptomyces sp. NPDC001858]
MARARLLVAYHPWGCREHGSAVRLSVEPAAGMDDGELFDA